MFTYMTISISHIQPPYISLSFLNALSHCNPHSLSLSKYVYRSCCIILSLSLFLSSSASCIFAMHLSFFLLNYYEYYLCLSLFAYSLSLSLSHIFPKNFTFPPLPPLLIPTGSITPAPALFAGKLTNILFGYFNHTLAVHLECSQEPNAPSSSSRTRAPKTG